MKKINQVRIGKVVVFHVPESGGFCATLESLGGVSLDSHSLAYTGPRGFGYSVMKAIDDLEVRCLGGLGWWMGKGVSKFGEVSK